MNILKYLLVSSVVLTVLSCDNDDDMDLETIGAMEIQFDNMVGDGQMALVEPGSQNYTYETSTGQRFNLSNFRYYISGIRLSGPNGASFEEEMHVSADADEVKGYYMIDESEAASQLITLQNVPTGKYDQITFTIGIAEAGVQEGAAGGILDPALGAPFWNWNAGYISMTIEGTAENSLQQEVAGHHGNAVSEKAFSLHIGGWKDIAPSEGETQKFYNNVKMITLDFGVAVSVSETMKPNVHIVADALKILKDIDFSTTYTVHSPAGGVPFAENLTTAFVVDHVHQ